MRLYKLVTLERRMGTSFILKGPDGRTVIGTMNLNAEKARHEMLLPEADFLKHAKALALLCRIAGCAMYVAEVIEPAVAEEDFIVTCERVLPDDTRYSRLIKIAKDERIDLSQCQTNKERIDKINAVTQNRLEQSRALAVAA